MDELITIVIIAAAISFKVVGKKLGSAGGDEVFPTIPVDPDMMKESDPMEEIGEDKDLFYRSSPVVDEMVIEEAERTVPAKPVEVKPQTPILEEEQPDRKSVV